MLKAIFRSLRQRSPRYPMPSGVPARLHLGCGRDIRDGWINLDSARLPGVDVIADLDDCQRRPLPFPDDSIDEFVGSHVLEHLHNPLPFMQELHRIAKPGAVVVFHVPYGSTDNADEDPTHVRRHFLNSFHYYSQLAYRSADYGYRGDWDTRKLTLKVDAVRHTGKSDTQLMEEIYALRNVVMEMVATLHAVKPIRVPGSAEAAGIPIVIQRAASPGA